MVGGLLGCRPLDVAHPPITVGGMRRLLPDRLRRLLCVHRYELVDSKITTMLDDGEPVTVCLMLSQCRDCGVWEVVESKIPNPDDVEAAMLDYLEEFRREMEL